MRRGTPGVPRRIAVFIENRISSERILILRDICDAEHAPGRSIGETMTPFDRIVNPATVVGGSR